MSFVPTVVRGSIVLETRQNILIGEGKAVILRQSTGGLIKCEGVSRRNVRSVGQFPYEVEITELLFTGQIYQENTNGI